mgnify:FL=1
MIDAGGAIDAASVPRPTGSVVLVGPPGAGCTTVGRALAASWGAPVSDLAETVAQELDAPEDLALVMVPETRYRRAEAETALGLLAEAGRRRRVVALGSGCLEDERVREALHVLVEEGGRVIALTATIRRLASRNGLDAPRSVALGHVHHEFVQMLRTRETACRELASVQIDTTETTPQEIVVAIDASRAAPTSG